jgi:hypothetical protein
VYTKLNSSTQKNRTFIAYSGFFFLFFLLSFQKLIHIYIYLCILKGDVNGDGYDDVIIGAWAADPNGYTQAGESYLVFGGVNTGRDGVFNLASLNGSQGCVFNGIDALDFSGYSVSSAGDFNGDGFADMIIGSPLADPHGKAYGGKSFIIFGGSDIGFNGTFDLGNLDGSNGFVFNGIDGSDNSGYSVSNAGDVNNDRYDDVIIGARGADGRGGSYVVYGGRYVGMSGSFELSQLNGTNGFAMKGIDGNDYCGESVSGIGDFNRDGYDDVIIGAHGADPNSANGAGESYIVFGVQTTTPSPTVSPFPTMVPSPSPSRVPSSQPTPQPSMKPSPLPTTTPTSVPTPLPTIIPTPLPTVLPNPAPSSAPTLLPSFVPTYIPSSIPTSLPTIIPSSSPTSLPSSLPTFQPTFPPTILPTQLPTSLPTRLPSNIPSVNPTMVPTVHPSNSPTSSPSVIPTPHPTSPPTSTPSSLPTIFPTSKPSALPTFFPTSKPTTIPTPSPSFVPEYTATNVEVSVCICAVHVIFFNVFTWLCCIFFLFSDLICI